MTNSSVRSIRSAWCLAFAGLLLATSPAVGGDEEKKEGKEAAKADAAAKKHRVALEQVSLEQFVGFDKNGDGYLREAELPEGWLARFDRSGDGSISKTEFVEINSRPEKLRRLHPMRDARARAADTTRSFDRNKDGVIQREEYPGRDDIFRGADRNRSGALEAGEVLQLAEEEIDDIRKRLRSPGKNEFLVLFDVDKDNRVGADEYDGPAAAFRKYDVDGDGVVTYDELYPAKMRNEKDEGPKPEQLTAVATLDKDEDGKVARAEFPGSDAAWRRLDRNGDGFVTAADAR
jgi:Ca2+-binding EF-hand superfamily protein